MNQTIVLMTCAVILASCNKGPQVNVTNATGNKVAQAVTQSGVMAGGSMLQPGEWQSRVKIEQMEIPGMSPELEGRMKQMVPTDKADPSNHCITEAEVKKPKADFFGADKSCTYDHFTMGGGKIDIAMVCHRDGGTQTSTANGTYTPTTYSADIESRTTAGRRAGAVIRIHADSQRIGECTGKDDEE